MVVSQQNFSPPAKSVPPGSLTMRCPRCNQEMGDLGDDDATLHCTRCTVKIPCERGVWKALLPERETHFARFLEDYQFVRAAEGRGSAGHEYYLALPYRDLSGRNRGQWAIRARTFRYILQHILPRIRSAPRQKLRILDLGAGNGWASYRLAEQHHLPVAVDLMVNDQDGLEAAEHFIKFLPRPFPRFQADANKLPFADGQFDLVMFNASFHYAECYEKTLGEALRCARKGGTILIADSPWYADEESGQRMLAERRAFFTKRYGFPSDELKSLEYLTDERLGRMEQQLGIRWEVHKPYYGLRWTLRPWLAKLRGRRIPSEFRIYTAGAPE